MRLNPLHESHLQESNPGQPSPIEREATWPRRYLSRTSSDKGSRNSGEIEHFPISRESFDSYRRSFVTRPVSPLTINNVNSPQDISAKTPAIIPPDALPPRQSLDSRVARYQPPAAAPPPRSPLAPPASYGRSSSDQQQYQNRRYFEPHAEERFEDVGLGDEGKGPQQSQQSQHEEGGGLHLFPRKRGFFAKFGGSESGTAPTTTTASSTEQAGGAGTGLSRLLPLGGGSGGRKRAQSGQGGQELGVMERPASSRGVLQAQEVEG